jgi:hypothetical protein
MRKRGWKEDVGSAVMNDLGKRDILRFGVGVRRMRLSGSLEIRREACMKKICCCVDEKKVG